MKQDIISREIWDAFVLKYSPQALFQSWDWGEVEKKLGHAVWRWGWFSKNTLVGVAQIKKVSARRGTFLHIRHGPIGKVNFEEIKELARAEGAWFIRISPQIKNATKFRGFSPAPIHAMDAEVCWVLDLNRSEDELLAGMRKTTRYEIRRAQKMGVIVKQGGIDFLKLYKQTSERHGFVEHTGIREELEIMDSLQLTATYDNKAVASAIIIFWGDEAIYHHGASVRNKVGASYLVQWEAIREAKKRKKKLYNFWGIAPDDSPNHPWRGLTAFKTGFGGRVVRFTHAQDYPISPLYVIPSTIEKIRKRLKGY